MELSDVDLTELHIRIPNVFACAHGFAKKTFAVKSDFTKSLDQLQNSAF